MSRRIFAIDYQDHSNIDVVTTLVAKLNEFKCADEIFVFAFDKTKIPDDINAKVIEFDNDVDNRSKCKNFITAYFKKLGYDGFLHVLEDCVELKTDPTEYLSQQEHCMDVLDYDVYFSTTSDGCNYVYSKFNPRVSISIDSPIFSGLNLPPKISFTSHSNTVWVTYNYAKIADDLLKFNEQFDIPMYYIIEFLSRRRNTKPNGSLYLMNQYLSIPSEIGVFSMASPKNSKQPSQQEMQKEDVIFKNMNLNFVPDNNIDQLLVDVINKLKSKI